jgi:hypothetical protein
MRDEVLTAAVDRWAEDPEFRAQARRDPESALPGNGSELTDDQPEAVREFRPLTVVMNASEINAMLAGGR